ncbi:MAG: tetratricopeptide repeat-containing sensor histidine kinase [Bacteroidetes bacterium]|nr:tetratricopeptide repeat-containing sensor histidine kinase [Bacteroidota bacterium]
MEFAFGQSNSAVPRLPDSLVNRPDSILISSYLSIGQKYADSSNTQALFYLNTGLELSKKNKSDFKTAEYYSSIAGIHSRWGDYTVALENFIKAYELFDSLGAERQIARTLLRIGNLFWFQKDFKNAISYYERSKSISDKIGDAVVSNYAFGNIGLCFNQLGEFDKALEIHRAKLKKSIELKDTVGIAIDYLNIASDLMGLKQYQQALTFFKKAEILSDKHLARDAVTQLYSDMANLYFNIGEFKNADFYISKSLAYARKYKFPVIQADALFLKSKIDSAFGNFRSAFLALAENRVIRDSISTAEIKKQTSIIEKQFDLKMSKREQELLKQENKIQKELLEKSENLNVLITLIGIILLFLIIAVFLAYRFKQKAHLQSVEQNTLLNKTNVKLQELNATKDKFFSIIAHDIRNPLTPALGFSDLLFNQYDLLDDETRKKHAKRIFLAISDLHKLLENLLQWSRAQTGALAYSPKPIRLTKEIETVLGLYRSTADEKTISLINETDQDLVVWADGDLLSGILRNLVNNAIKFTGEQGSVKIQTESINPDMLKIKVVDNGVGISLENQYKIFRLDQTVSQKGTSGENGTGLGLILCKEFAEKNRGEIGFFSEEGKGTTFWFTVPFAHFGISESV